MSTETIIPAEKKSFLTRVMESAADRKAKMVSDETTPTSEEVRAKRSLKKFGLVLAGTVAATTAIIVIANRMGNEETDAEAEETISED